MLLYSQDEASEELSKFQMKLLKTMKLSFWKASNEDSGRASRKALSTGTGSVSNEPTKRLLKA